MVRFTLVLFILLSFTASAARFDITGDIGQIRYHEASSSFAPLWRKHTWFEIVNPETKPNCKSYASGTYAISIPENNETALTLLLSAKMANKQVMVTLDDSILFPDNGYCKLQYLTIL
ncbi:hypothetical protein [Vibrio coralliilyticus]|uniref:hypothetical protein n=1 Tax=Vibrio coralliilyticus TaxID=190893 RepID=UPI00148E3702|nr:hypothetical protein [Vibrio coralliilyticus]NOI30618.1 hypothetical protein [Vibrio coralliilyticus]NOI49834.1 hypothetical protein [Vibrio coralliilyticus]